jgi:hypothetical protein
MGDALGDEPDLVGDAFPLRHLRRRLDALQLLAKRSCMNVFRERAFAPGATPRWQVARERMETALHVGLREVFDQLPGDGRIGRPLEDHEARPAGNRSAGSVHPR